MTQTIACLMQFRIDACGRRLEAAHGRYVRDGTFIDAADVDRWQRAFYAAIRARNASYAPAEISAWEAARGLVSMGWNH
jgi:hypothetical protein